MNIDPKRISANRKARTTRTITPVPTHDDWTTDEVYDHCGYWKKYDRKVFRVRLAQLRNGWNSNQHEEAQAAGKTARTFGEVPGFTKPEHWYKRGRTVFYTPAGRERLRAILPL